MLSYTPVAIEPGTNMLPSSGPRASSEMTHIVPLCNVKDLLERLAA